MLAGGVVPVEMVEVETVLCQFSSETSGLRIVDTLDVVVVGDEGVVVGGAVLVAPEPTDF